MRIKQIGLALVMAVFGAAQLVLAGPPSSAPDEVPADRLVQAAADALCQYLGWFCS